MRYVRSLGWLALPLVLAACASMGGSSEQQRRADYEAAAGKPVSSFRFFSSMWSWEPLGNDRVAVYTRPSEAWLLDVPGCIDLAFTNTIGLTSNIHQVSVGFDKVLTGRRDFPCTITRIRPVDVKKLKASEVARRQVEERPREAPPAAAGSVQE